VLSCGRADAAMWAWRSIIVIAVCVSVGCTVVGLIEWYVLECGVRDLICAVVGDPATSPRCAAVWEPTPKPWLIAAVASGSLALVGVARVELDGRGSRVEFAE